MYEDGSEYEGEWLKGVRNGYGIFTFPNCKVKYEGEWYNDTRNGWGITTFSNGIVREGEYRNDKLVLEFK